MDELDAAARTGGSDETASGSEMEMTVKERLLAALAAASPGDVAAMLDRLWPLCPFCVRQAPRAGLVMVTVRDPFDTAFHLGEVLVSEAEVELDGHTGYGAVCGDEPDHALLLAAVAAVELSGRTEVPGAIAALLDQLESASATRKAHFSKLAAATEVRFESMKKEHVDFGSLGG
jgi:alpha-D-ribose 1-methylphosphonate 5-triphosphate synthase subunit PhnG